MTTFVKTIFTFKESKQKDLKIDGEILKIQSYIRDIHRDKTTNIIALRLKEIMNITLGPSKGLSLFEIAYINSLKQSAIEWVPISNKIIELLAPKSAFMTLIQQLKDIKIPIDKSFLPDFLFKNNMINEKSGYLGISFSLKGNTVSAIEYLFIRLANAIYNIKLLEKSKSLDSQYQTDDIYSAISINPYLLLLRDYLEYFHQNEKIFPKLIGNLKMFFVDEILIKHRINRSSSLLGNFSLFNSNYKIEPQHFLVIFLILRRGRNLFEQRQIYFRQILNHYNSLIRNQKEIYLRYLFRTIIYSCFSRSIENIVVDQFSQANAKQGVFEIERYDSFEFANSIKGSDFKQIKQFDNLKTQIAQLLDKDHNYVEDGEIHSSFMRTITCFLIVEKEQKKFKQSHLFDNRTSLRESNRPENRFSSKSMDYVDDRFLNHQFNSRNNLIEPLQKAILKLIRYVNTNKRLRKKLNDKLFQKLKQQIDILVKLFYEVYGREINLKRLQDSSQDEYLNRNLNIRGEEDDYVRTLTAYKNDCEENCWKIPLQDSQFQILYKLFYGIAKKVDKIIPGHIKRNQPLLNLRIFCNPFIFMLALVLILFMIRVIF